MRGQERVPESCPLEWPDLALTLSVGIGSGVHQDSGRASENQVDDVGPLQPFLRLPPLLVTQALSSRGAETSRCFSRLNHFPSFPQGEPSPGDLLRQPCQSTKPRSPTQFTPSLLVSLTIRWHLVTSGKSGSVCARPSTFPQAQRGFLAAKAQTKGQASRSGQRLEASMTSFFEFCFLTLRL